MKVLFSLCLSLFAITAHAANFENLDRKLGRAEMEKLLPLYVAAVENTAGVLPSPEDNSILSMTAASVTNPIYSNFKNGKIIGLQSHTIDALIAEMEHAVRELKSRTTQDRRAEVADLVSGMKGRLTKRLSCQLGYKSNFKSADERIVKCIDDRSVAGSEHGTDDDEGYSDIRTIILSIDAKTLLPTAVLSVDHFQAG